MNATFGDRRSRLSWALAACVTLGALPAYGSGAENVATARELYKQGADALDAGKSSLAVERLTAAWALVQTPVIGFDLARAHLAMGHLVEAREAALAVARTPVAPDETTRSTQARGDADKLATSIAPRIPRVNIRFAGGALGHATVKLDGVVVPEAALTVSRQTNPGTHTAVVDTDDGRHAEGTATVAEGETKELVLTLPAPIVAPPPAAVAVVPPPAVVTPAEPRDHAPTSESHLSPLVWIGGVAGGLGLAVGAITGAFALSEASTVRSGCSQKVGADFACPPELSSDLSAAHTFATVSTIGFITAGVGAGVLVLGVVLSGKRSPDTHAGVRVLPMLGPISGIAGTF